MAKDKEPADGEGEEGGGGKKKLIMIVAPVLLVVVGAALYFFVFSGGSSDTAAKEGTSASASAEGDGSEADAESSGSEDETTSEGETTESSGTSVSVPSPPAGQTAGKLVTTDAITINLANGHYLKVSFALQATAAAGEEVTTGKALDAAIQVYSGKTVDELATAEGRNAAKKTLLKMVKKLYEDEVYGIYYTSFVMN